MLQCQSIISGYTDINQVDKNEDRNEELKKELIELDELMKAYLEMLSAIPKITCKYYNLHRTIRVDIRKIQVQHLKRSQRKLKSKE